jgi:hypothetical protein
LLGRAQFISQRNEVYIGLSDDGEVVSEDAHF